jgi:hypothetical protein
MNRAGVDTSTPSFNAPTTSPMPLASGHTHSPMGSETMGSQTMTSPTQAHTPASQSVGHQARSDVMMEQSITTAVSATPSPPLVAMHTPEALGSHTVNVMPAQMPAMAPTAAQEVVPMVSASMTQPLATPTPQTDVTIKTEWNKPE